MTCLVCVVTDTDMGVHDEICVVCIVELRCHS